MRPALPDHAVEPRVVHHLEDGAHAAPLLADAGARSAPRTRPRSTRSSGCRACPSGAGCGTRCAMPSGSERGTRKQESAALGLRQRQERVATSARSRTTCGRRARTRVRAAARRRARVVLARTSQPPCFSVIAMPIERGLASARRAARRGSYAVPRTRGSHSRGDVAAAWRSAGTQAKVMVSGQQEPASTWREQRVQRRARDVRARRAARATAGCAPRAAIASAMMRVPGRVELDLVDAMAEAVVAAELRRVSVGARGRAPAPPRCPATAPKAATRSRRPSPRPRASRPSRSAASPAKRFDVLEGRRLVLDLVGAEAVRRHGGSIAPGLVRGSAFRLRARS